VPPSFDLLTQPWLPCLPLDSDAPDSLPLLDALTEAHHYRELVADSPLMSVALHRLLLAVLHRAYMGPRNVEEWRAMRNAGHFDAERLRAYLMDSRWRAHFDLFDTRRPFYQVLRMEDTEPVSVAKLSLERASGNNITLFDHTTGDTAAFTPAIAARYLVAFQLYAVGGGVNRPFNFSDGPLARDYSVLVRGDTLFETLMLNLLRYDDESFLGRPLSTDSPWWERDSDSEPDSKGSAPTGYCDYLTWQSRRVHLLFDEDAGVIRMCQVRQNLKLSPSLNPLDPFKAYRQDNKRGKVSRRLSDKKAVWRDSHALLEEASNDGSRPEIFQWLALLFPTIRPGSARAFAFEVIGYRTDGPQGAVTLWRRDRLPLPLCYLFAEGKPLRDELDSGLKSAEEVGRLFRAGRVPVPQESGKFKNWPSPMWVLAKELLTMAPERTPDEKKDIAPLADHFAAERAYWAALEPPFRRFMRVLAEQPVGDQSLEEHCEVALSAWKEEVRVIAKHTFNELVAALESDARSLRAAALAQRRFNWLLNLTLPVERIKTPAVGRNERVEMRA
jgi:CRISPR system Cascade subunit CasA